MTVQNSKFSNFATGGDLLINDIVVGLRGGINTKFTYAGVIPEGTIVPITQGGTGADNASDARANLGLAIGSDVEAWSAVLDGVAALASTGVVVQTAASTFANRTLTGAANQITVTNGSGVAGAPTFTLSATAVMPGTLTFGGLVNTAGNTITNSVTNGDLLLTTNGSGLLTLNATQGVAGISNDGTMAADSATLLPTQAAVKAYADTIASGFTFVAGGPCIAATTTNFTSAYANGAAGVGATLTQSVAAVVVIDGVTLTANQRVLFHSQTSTLENGIYQMSTTGTGVTQAIFTRTTDYDQVAEIIPGSSVPVSSGNTYGGSIWTETSTVSAIGTSPITFQLVAQPSNNFVTIATVQTITGVKSFTNGTLKLLGSGSGYSLLEAAAVAGTTTFTLPSTTDTLAGLAATQTLTNKTIVGSSNTLSAIPYTALANGTAGELLTWSAGNAIATVATGAAGQVLTSNGAGAAPTMQAATAGAVAATTAQQETGTDITVFTSPGTQKYHNSACQVGIQYNQISGGVIYSYGVSSTVNNSTGTWTCFFTNLYLANTYCLNVSAASGIYTVGTQNGNAFVITTKNSNNGVVQNTLSQVLCQGLIGL